jgi:hypothetical protein
MAKQYIFNGRVELSGVQFIVEAENEDDAKAKAKRGEWEDYDLSGAETVNTDIYVSTCQLDE